MSIPRDSWVEIPGHGYTGQDQRRLLLRGPSLTIHTVENLTGIRIDYFAAGELRVLRRADR